MSEVPLEFLAAYRVSPEFKGNIESSSIPGGVVGISSEILGILKNAFDGNLPKKDKRQPFHFEFSPGRERRNEMRSLIDGFVQGDDHVKAKIAHSIAKRLNTFIDKRVGELLLTIGCGSADSSSKVVLWVYPQENPLQFRTREGIPKISEIKDAFSKSSQLRKAVFFETPTNVGRNDLLGGTIVDTTAGRLKGSSDYWLTKFLAGTIELLPSKGTALLVSALLKAQDRAKTAEEKSSVKSVYYALLTRQHPPTTLNEISERLVGGAKEVFQRMVPKTSESNARFAIDMEIVVAKIKKKIFLLTTGIEVHFPPGDDFDADGYIEKTATNRIMTIHEEIADEYFK
jgi:hypothetical protein